MYTYLKVTLSVFGQGKKFLNFLKSQGFVVKINFVLILFGWLNYSFYLKILWYNLLTLVKIKYQKNLFLILRKKIKFNFSIYSGAAWKN